MPEFKIALRSVGDNPADWSSLASILDACDPDWTFKKYQEVITLGNSDKSGRGYPSATWTWRGIDETDREILRAFCADLSSEVYIETPTNETTVGEIVWMDAAATMNWMEEEEEKNSDHTLDFVVTFTKMVSV